LLYFIIRLIIKIYQKIDNEYKAYLLNEKYWFSKFTHSSIALPKLLNNLYAWWDRFPVSNKSASLQKDAISRNENDIDQQLAAYYKQEYADGDMDAKAKTGFKNSIKKYRKELMQNGASRPNKNITDNQTEWK